MIAARSTRRAGYLPHVDLTLGWGREMAKVSMPAYALSYRGSLNQNLWDFGVTINDIMTEAIAHDITSAYLGVRSGRSWLTRRRGDRRDAEDPAGRHHPEDPPDHPKPISTGRRAGCRTSSPRRSNREALANRNAYRWLTDHLPAAVSELPARRDRRPPVPRGS
jgi:hypothetical protein